MHRMVRVSELRVHARDDVDCTRRRDAAARVNIHEKHPSIIP